MNGLISKSLFKGESEDDEEDDEGQSFSEQ
jgi:hypothetical protein